MENTLSKLRHEAEAIVRQVENDPEGRLQLREQFYRRFGFGEEEEFRFGNSELAFLRWEIRRGVLNPVDDPGRAGSPWWRDVNSRFLYYSELAGLIWEKAPTLSGVEQPAQFWLDYIKKPSDQSWYRAHNASILSGYFDSRELAGEESKPEQIFLNMVLYRLLYAQSDVEGVSLGFLGKILADPCLPSVDGLVHIPAFYPDHYPLDKEDIINILHEGHSLGDEIARLLDEDIIIPCLPRLYLEAVGWNRTPELPRFLHNGAPVYPELSEGPSGIEHFTNPLKRYWQFLRFFILHLISDQ
jgi:hypothetical protein